MRGDVSFESITNDTLYSITSLELRSLSFVCVNSFILISGYFGIKWKWNSFFNYIFQVFFWVIFTYFLAIACGWQVFDTGIFLKRIVTFLSYNYFVLSYLGLFLFAPMLNNYVESSSEKHLRNFILLFYVFSTLFAWILQASPEMKEGCTFVSFMGLYLIGAYIRKYDKKIFSYNKYVDMMIFLGLGFFLVGVSVVALYFGIKSSVYGYLNPIVIVQTVYFFLFFKKIDFSSKMVNWIAASAFSVFLFHYNPSIFPQYENVCNYIIDRYEYNLPYIIIFLIIVFMFSVLVDKIRMFVYDALKNICLAFNKK